MFFTIVKCKNEELLPVKKRREKDKIYLQVFDHRIHRNEDDGESFSGTQ